MTVQTIELSKITPSRANPRKHFDKGTIRGLAESIKTDGLLQNLVLTPVKGKDERYRILGGERRYKALSLLVKQGDLPEDYAVSAEIREDLSKDEALRIATVENLQREDLSPMEETAALTRLIHGKVTPGDIAAQTGLSLSTIRRRLALNGLSDESQQALREGLITLSQAEALTLGDEESQDYVLRQMERGGYVPTGSDIRRHMLADKASVAMAIFPLESYSGTITTDLFADEESSYFDDEEEFFRLQQEAVEALAERHGETAAWVEVTQEYNISRWLYEEAEDGQPSGVLINFAPTGRVTVAEGMIERDLTEDTRQTLAPAAAAKPKSSYPSGLRRLIAYHKTAAVQAALLSDPRKALELAVVRLLDRLSPHEAYWAFAEDDAPPASYRTLEQNDATHMKRLGFEDDIRAARYEGTQALYEAVKCLDDEALRDLHVFLTAIEFGQKDCGSFDCSDSLFNRTAQDLGIAMREHWAPDKRFFGQRTKAQLAKIGVEIGYASNERSLLSCKKADLVAALTKHMAEAVEAPEPTKAQRKAREWLPGVMAFPAIDPDAEGEDADSDTAEAA